MAANLLETTRPTIDPDEPTRAHAEIGEPWQIIYSQGGVVMSTMLRAAEAVLDRPDLRLSSMAATFVQPVGAGPVVIDVNVLRSGRGGAQVYVELRTDADRSSAPNAVITAVYIAPDPDGVRARGVVMPTPLASPPPEGFIVSSAGQNLNFLNETEWVLTPDQPEDEPRRYLWFRFLDAPLTDDGTWERSSIVVAGDTLGGAIDAAIGRGTVFAVSLQISAQFYGDARGEWLGLDTVAWDIGDGMSSGLATVWDSDGELIATVTQTAKLRTNW